MTQLEAAAEPTAFAAWRALGMLIQLVVTDPGQLPAARQMLTDDLVTTTVSPLLAEAIKVALRAASLTDGDVDPTVGGVLSALGYDRDFGEVPATGPALPQVRAR